jgi:hypothetical protein
MAPYVSKAFVVLVHIPVENGLAERESFVVGCSTREEAEAEIRSLYPSEQGFLHWRYPLPKRKGSI